MQQILFLILGSFTIAWAAPEQQTPKEIEYVEIQWTICPKDSIALWDFARTRDGAETKNWLTTFRDTPDLTLFARGMVFRFREFPDSTVKTSLKRNFTEEEFAKSTLEERMGGECEGDLYGDRYKIACALKFEGDSRGEAISREQREILRTQLNLRLSDTEIIGPARTYRTEFSLGRLRDDETSAFEIMFDNHGSSYAELSVRVKAARTQIVKRDIDRLLEERQISQCAIEGSKTLAILNSFRNQRVP